MTIQSPVQPPPNQPQISLLPTNPLGVGDLIDRSFRLYRRNFKAFLYMAGVLLLPWTIITGFFTQSIMQNQLLVMQQMLTQELGDPAAIERQLSQLSNTAGFVGLSFLLSLVGGVLYLLTYLGLFTLVIRTLHGESATLSAGFAGARRNFWASVRLGILFFLVVMGLGLLMFLAFAIVAAVGGGLLGALTGSGGDSENAIGVLVAFCCIMPLAFLLILGPIIYFGSRWSVVMPALVDNESGARRSMRISWELTRGNIWRVIGYFALVYLLSIVVFALPFYMIQGSMLLLLGMDLIWLSALLGTVLSAILTTLWLPMTAILPTMLYYDLRTRDDIASGRGRSSAASIAPASSPVGQPAVSTPPYAGPTWAPETPSAPPKAPVAPASPTTPAPPSTSASSPYQTPTSWSQSEEPEDPWESPRPPAGNDL